MTQNETFQAKVIAALSTPGGEEAVKIFESLDAAVKLFEGDAKAAAARVADLVKQFRNGAVDLAQFKAEMQGMGDFLKTLSTSQKTLKLFEPQDIKNILDAARAIKQASDAMVQLQQNQGVARGNFGLDSRSIKETNDSLKVLQTNLNAVTLAAQKQPNNPGLYLQKVQIESNIESLKRHQAALGLTRDAFNQVAMNMETMAKAELTAAQKRNKALVDEEKRAQGQRIAQRRQDVRAAFAEDDKAQKERIAVTRQGFDNFLKVIQNWDKEQIVSAQKRNQQILAEEKRATNERLAEKRREVREAVAEQNKADAAAQRRLDARVRVKDLRDEYYKTTPGAQAAFGRFDFEQARNGLFGNMGYVQSRMAGAQRQDDLRYLKDAYASANIAYRSSAALITDSQTVKASLAQITALEKQIVDYRRSGRQLADDELRIFKEISQLRKTVNLQRQTDRANDPQLNAADRGRQTQNMLDRITGESGGALLAVQASLMANYSILTGVVNGVQQAITYSLDLEAAFKNIQAVTDTTSIEMVGLEKSIKSVAGSTKFSAKEVSDAALILGQAGLTAKQVAESIQPVVMLATASGASLEQAVDIVTSVVGVFNVTTAETADVANKITQSVNVSKLSIDKLALGFQYAGNTAAQLGVSFEEVTAAMAAMSNAGIKSGSTMGTGLRQLLIELQNPTEEFVATLHGVGLTIADLDLKTQSFSEVLRKLRDSGFVASDAIKSFDVRGAAAFNALIANPEMMDDVIRQLNESQAAVKANDIQMESLRNQGLRLTSALGNLVSTALTPTQQALSVLVGGLASGVQAVSEMTGAVEILGTVLAGALAAGAFSVISTTMANLVAIAPRLMAMSAAAPVLASIGGAIMSVSAAATAATGSLGVLSLLLSPTGIGVAIAAVTGAYFLFSGAIETNAEKIEKETAALNLAKGALDEKSQAVDSLSKKISELEAKTEFFRQDQEALAVETTALTSKFGQFGFSMVGAANDIDVILNRLRTLRAELAQLQGIELQNVAARASSLAAEKEKQARDEASNYTSGFFRRGSSAAGALTDTRRADLASLLKDEGGANSRAFQLLQNYNRQLQAGRAPNEIGELATVSATLNRLVSTLETQKSSGTFKGTQEFENVLRFAAESTRKLSEATSGARIARQEADSAQRTADNQAQYESFSKNFNLDNRLNVSPNISQAARKQLGEGASPTDLYRTGVTLYNKAMADLQVVSKDLESQLKKEGVDSNVASRARQEVTAKGAELRRELEQLRKGADPYLKLEDKDAQRSYELEARALKTKQRGGKDVLAERIALEQKRGAELVEERLRALTDKTGPEAENIRREIDQQVQFKIDDIREQAEQAGNKIAGRQLNVVARSLEQQADVQMKAAKVAKSSVKPQDGFDELGRVMDEGLKHIAEARSLDLKATAEKIRAGEATESDLATVKEKYSLAAEEFINSFRDMYSAAAKRMYDMRDTIKKAQNDLKQMQLDAETREFERGNQLRELDISAAQNGSVGQKRARRESEYGGASAGLGDVRAQGKVISDLIAGVMGQLTSLKSERLSNEQDFSKYKNLSPAEIEALSPEQKREMFELESRIREQVELINKLEALGIQYQKEKRDLTREEYELRLRMAKSEGTTRTPAGVDTYRKGIGRAIEDYQEDLKQFNPEEVISERFYGLLGDLDNQFSTFFTDIVTGSASAEDAFKNFAAGVIKSMLDIVSQQLAMQALQMIFGAFTGGFGGGIDTGGATMLPTSSSGALTMPIAARHGGAVNQYGKIQTFAGGGSVRGGTPGRDSVPALVMPGEFVLKTSAVDAVGTDFLHALNNAGNTVASNSAPKTGSMMDSGSSGSGVLNIWVVTPDQQSQIGPRDIVAVVTDDISRGGSIKQLVKQVQLGNV